MTSKGEAQAAMCKEMAVDAWVATRQEAGTSTCAAMLVGIAADAQAAMCKETAADAQAAVHARAVTLAAGLSRKRTSNRPMGDC
jgi:hypothetical protein